jgi:hypothetical protein
VKKWVIRCDDDFKGYVRVIPKGHKGIWERVLNVLHATKFASKEDAESVAFLFATISPGWIGQLCVRVWYGDRGGQP